MGKWRVALAALLAALALGGCNTIQGLGQDLSRAGEAIGDAARGR